MERRAYKHALYAVQDEQAALDIVQDSMLKLSEKYSAQPAEEYPFLFQRILSNTINDFYRRQKVRNFWTTLMSALTPGTNSNNNKNTLYEDPVAETIDFEDESSLGENPQTHLERLQTLGLIEEALQKLPPRQREAFLLRYWEDMDVAQTAAIMGCSEGSVKTHCSRATHTLAEYLSAKGIGYSRKKSASTKATNSSDEAEPTSM